MFFMSGELLHWCLMYRHENTWCIATLMYVAVVCLLVLHCYLYVCFIVRLMSPVLCWCLLNCCYGVLWNNMLMCVEICWCASHFVYVLDDCVNVYSAIRLIMPVVMLVSVEWLYRRPLHWCVLSDKCCTYMLNICWIYIQGFSHLRTLITDQSKMLKPEPDIPVRSDCYNFICEMQIVPVETKHVVMLLIIHVR